jgi:uncharacterized SAM-binding protein YcdF (DUF218 family)
VLRRPLRLLAVLLLVASVAAAVTPIRRGALLRIGRHLSASDQPASADLLAMDVESGFAGAIKLGDLYRQHAAPAVGLLVPRQTALDDALRGRRIVLPDVMRDVLLQLGIPKHAIVQMPAGEGGTTETAAALAGWSRANPAARVVVVVGPSHGRRYRRTLLRAWPDGHPTPRVVTTEYALFRADDWWQSRTTLREGLFEVEKLGLDYALHPW